MMTFIKKHPIKLVLLGLVISKILHLIVTADPPGYCSSEPYTSVKNQYLSDEEFIKNALRDGYLGKISIEDKSGEAEKKDEKVILNYLEKYPDCCEVYRKSTNGVVVHQNLWDRAFWHHQTVVVRIRDIESMEATRQGNYPLHEDTFLSMSVCGKYLD